MSFPVCLGAGLVALQVRAIVGSRYPGLRALEALARHCS